MTLSDFAKTNIINIATNSQQEETTKDFQYFSSPQVQDSVIKSTTQDHQNLTEEISSALKAEQENLQKLNEDVMDKQVEDMNKMKELYSKEDTDLDLCNWLKSKNFCDAKVCPGDECMTDEEIKKNSETIKENLYKGEKTFEELEDKRKKDITSFYAKNTRLINNCKDKLENECGDAKGENIGVAWFKNDLTKSGLKENWYVDDFENDRVHQIKGVQVKDGSTGIHFDQAGIQSWFKIGERYKFIKSFSERVERDAVDGEVFYARNLSVIDNCQDVSAQTYDCGALNGEKTGVAWFKNDLTQDGLKENWYIDSENDRVQIKNIQVKDGLTGIDFNQEGIKSWFKSGKKYRFLKPPDTIYATNTKLINNCKDKLENDCGVAKGQNIGVAWFTNNWPGGVGENWFVENSEIGRVQIKGLQEKDGFTVINFNKQGIKYWFNQGKEYKFSKPSESDLTAKIEIVESEPSDAVDNETIYGRSSIVFNNCQSLGEDKCGNMSGKSVGVAWFEDDLSSKGLKPNWYVDKSEIGRLEIKGVQVKDGFTGIHFDQTGIKYWFDPGKRYKFTNPIDHKAIRAAKEAAAKAAAAKAAAEEAAALKAAAEKAAAAAKSAAEKAAAEKAAAAARAAEKKAAAAKAVQEKAAAKQKKMDAIDLEIEDVRERGRGRLRLCTDVSSCNAICNEIINPVPDFNAYLTNVFGSCGDLGESVCGSEAKKSRGVAWFQNDLNKMYGLTEDWYVNTGIGPVQIKGVQVKDGVTGIHFNQRFYAPGWFGGREYKFFKRKSEEIKQNYEICHLIDKKECVRRDFADCNIMCGTRDSVDKMICGRLEKYTVAEEIAAIANCELQKNCFELHECRMFADHRRMNWEDLSLERTNNRAGRRAYDDRGYRRRGPHLPESTVFNMKAYNKIKELVPKIKTKDDLRTLPPGCLYFEKQNTVGFLDSRTEYKQHGMCNAFPGVKCVTKDTYTKI